SFTSYQYSIIRYHHDATTHEFLNIGVALYSPTKKYFKVQITNRFSRITDAFFDARGNDYRRYVSKILRRFEDLTERLNSPQRDMFSAETSSIEELLRLYIRKDSSFRYSVPSSGIAPTGPGELDSVFIRLFDDYVERYNRREERASRTEQEVWKNSFRPQIEQVIPNVLTKLEPVSIKTRIEYLEYEYSYKNGSRHIIEPISFDLTDSYYIQRKAHTTLGKNVLLSTSNEVSHLYLLLGKPNNKSEEIGASYEKAKKIIVADHFNFDVQIIEENSSRDFALYLKTLINPK
ncbi:MAG: DUF3037 domain-containing protein, partial [Anaerolineales bacterium]|nr:DUF3037 domain-containing protein [Anaerolineales bacterium]